MAIICANLPTYRPLFPRSGFFGETFKSWYRSLLRTLHDSRHPASEGPSGGASDLGSKHYRQLYGNGGDETYLAKSISGHPSEHNEVANEAYSMHAINVQREVDVDVQRGPVMV